jgi:hypothetical protein
MIADAAAQGNYLSWDEIPLVRESFKDNVEETPAEIAQGWGLFLKSPTKTF